MQYEILPNPSMRPAHPKQRYCKNTCISHKCTLKNYFKKLVKLNLAMYKKDDTS